MAFRRVLGDDIESEEEEEDDLLSAFCSASSLSSFGPLCAFIGGVISQEVIKAASGRYTPVGQWMYHDAMEVGEDDAIANKKILVVGAGVN